MYDDDLYDEEESYPRFTVEDALNALPLKREGIVPPAVVFGFSDLEPDQLEQVRPIWQKLPEDQRVMIMERLAEGSEADFALDYTLFSRLGYDDPAAAVRIAALQAGWTDESLPTLHRLMEIAKHDPVAEVRAAAITQVGRFIYLGEIEEISKADSEPAEELALSLHTDPKESIDVQRRALEALAHSSRPGIEKLIQAAYEHDDFMMRVSAVNAMGNSCDDHWASIIMDELDSPNAEMCFEAIRAAGAIGLAQCVHRLSELSYSDDQQLQEAAIWSLGEIGGDQAIAALNQLQLFAEEMDDDDLLDCIEDALAVASMMSDLDFDFELLDFDPDLDDEDDDWER